MFLPLLLFLVLSTPLFGADLEELVGPEKAALLRAASELSDPASLSEPVSLSEPIIELQLKNPSPRLLPLHGELQRLVNETLRNLEPNILVETLSLYPLPSRHDRNFSGWSTDEQTSLLNQLVALSSLSGIQYYSESRKTMRVFYESSVVIDSPSGKRPQPDPVFTSRPSSLVLYARQKDLTFGDNTYRYEYHTGTDSIIFIQENISSMTIGIIPAVGRNKFRTVVAVIDAGDSLLLYAGAMAKTASVSGMGNRIGASFTNRAKAILGWFAGRANMVF
jgi:hypothetical protein